MSAASRTCGTMYVISDSSPAWRRLGAIRPNNVRLWINV